MAKQADRTTRAPREVAIAPPEETADVKFREGGAVSPYRDLLEDLQDAPKGSTLKIARAARYTAVKHIRDLGLKVLWGKDLKHPDVLYIKIVGQAEPPLTMERAISTAAAERKAPADILRKAAALPGPIGARLDPAQELLMRTLKMEGPTVLKRLAGVLGVSRNDCFDALKPLIDGNLIEVDGGCYRIKGV
jgi:hypothetical protein